MPVWHRQAGAQGKANKQGKASSGKVSSVSESSQGVGSQMPTRCTVRRPEGRSELTLPFVLPPPCAPTLAYTIAYRPCAPRLLTLWARAGACVYACKKGSKPWC
jgi:hypothetical protein